MILGRKKSCIQIISDGDESPALVENSVPVEKSVPELAGAQSDVIDGDGFLADIDVQAVPEVQKTTLKERSRDVENFFSLPYQNNGKNYRNCNLCS